MAESKLVVVINARDRASGPIKKLRVAFQGLGRMSDKVSARFGGFDGASGKLRIALKKLRGAANKARQALGKLANAMKTAVVAGAKAAAVAIVGLGLGVSKLISMGSDAEEMMGKFRVVFGQYADGMIKDLDSMAAATGRSKFALRGMAASVQDTFVPLGFARGEAAKFSKQLTKLAIDVGSFNNVTEADVLRDFQSALVGNTETVRKYGIVINQAAIAQEAQRLGLVKMMPDTKAIEKAQKKLGKAQRRLNKGFRQSAKITARGKGEAKDLTEHFLNLTDAEKALAAAQSARVAGPLTDQAKVQAILSLITQGSADAMGDAERTAQSWANQMRALKSVIKDTATEMGIKLLPVVTPFLRRITSFARDIGPRVVIAFENILEMVGKFGNGLSAIKDSLSLGLFPVLSDLAGETLTKLKAVLNTVVHAMHEFALTVKSGVTPLQTLQLLLQKYVSMNVGIAFGAITDKIKDLLSQVRKVLHPFVEWIKQNVKMRDIFGAVAVVIASIVVPAIGAVLAAVLPVIAAFGALVLIVKAVREAWAENTNDIRGKTARTVEKLKEFARWLRDQIPVAMERAKAFWTDTLRPALKGLWEFTTTKVIPALLDFAGWLREKIPVAIEKMKTFWEEKLQPALKDLWELVTTKVVPVLLVFTRWLQVKIPTAIEKVKRFWEEKLQPVLKGLWKFTSTHVVPVLIRLARWIGERLPGYFSALNRAWKTFLKPVLTGIISDAQMVWDKIQKLIDKFRELKDMISSIPKPSLPSLPGGTTPGAAYMRRDIPVYNTPSIPYIPPTYGTPTTPYEEPIYGAHGSRLQFVYAPVVSTGSEREVERVLRPALDRWYRDARRRRV